MKQLVGLTLALLSLAAGEALADNKETLDAARAAYYSLRREGLTSFWPRAGAPTRLPPPRLTRPSPASRSVSRWRPGSIPR